MPQEYTFDEVTAAPEPTSYSFDELKPQTEWSFDELKPTEAKPEDFQAFSELGPTQADTAYLEQPLIPIPTLKGESTLGKIGAGAFNVAKSIPEFMETPAGLATLPASFIPGAGPVLQGLFAGLAAKQAGEKLGEASVTKDVQDYTEGVLGAALAPAIGLPHSAKATLESIKETVDQIGKPELPEAAATPEVSDASSQPSTATVYGDVRTQPVAGEGQVPVQESGEGVRPNIQEGTPAAPGTRIVPPEAEQARVPLEQPSIPGEVVGMGGATPSEFSPEVATPDVYGIAERVRESRAAAGQVEPVEPGQGIAAKDSVEAGRQLIQSGVDPIKVMDEFEKTKRLSSEDMAVSRAYGETLAAQARTIEETKGTGSPEYQKAYDELSAWDKRSKAMQTEWHKSGMAQQGMTDLDTGSFTGLAREFKDQTGKDFSKGQEKVAQRKAKSVKEVKAEEQQAREVFVKATQETRSLTDAEKAAQQAVWRQHREAAIRGAKAENAKRLADIDRADAVMAVQEAAKKRAQDAVNKTLTGMAKKAADLENAKRVKAADDRLKIAEAARKKADIKLRKAQAEIRNAAIKAVRANNKLRVLKADLPDWAWTKAKEYIVTGHENLNDIVAKIGTDTGLSNKQVLDALGKDKRKKYLADDLWKKQQRVRLLDQSAKRWLKQQQMPFLLRKGEQLASGMFNLKIGGGLHGFVALGTHAPMMFFRPNLAKLYIQKYGQMASMIKNRAFYEASIQDLQRRPNYRRAQEAGLGNNPYMFEDFSTGTMAPWKKFLGVDKLQAALGAGNRGYSVLKFLRQDLFDLAWDKLNLTEKTPEMAKVIATIANHETGWSQKAGFRGAHLGLFAPRLLMAKTGYVFGDPLKALGVAAKMAASTVSNWEKATPAEKYFAAHVFKEKATVIATMASMLAINQAILSALGSDQKINGVPEELGGKGFDPMASDFLKFKGAGKTVSYGNSFIALARLPLRIQANIENKSKLNKIVYEDENVYKTIGNFARTQLSPAAGAATDLAFGRDFQGRPLPSKGFGTMEGDSNVPKRLRAQGVQPYTWPEYLTVTALPIPLAEAMHDVWHDGYGLDEKGVDWMQKLWAIIQTIPETGAMALTGARIGEDYDVKK
jgi:hypothetical protein